MQRNAVFGLLELMTKLGSAYKLLCEYKLNEAVNQLEQLPLNHIKTGFVLSTLGRAYFEMTEYDEAIICFQKCRQLEPHRLQGMDIYSTALWHQRKELELSLLSQTLVTFDKFAPETWCVAGNCFSLQMEHETAVTFLKRAIQVDPDFCYAYTLLGYELMQVDQIDDAMASFRTAVRINPRHYNGWYGMGLIFCGQKRIAPAYHNFKRALDISPNNPLLMCHCAAMCHNQKIAAQMLDKASEMFPYHAMVKYHRACIHYVLGNYDVALEELEHLREMKPKESKINFLLELVRMPDRAEMTTIFYLIIFKLITEFSS